MTDLQIIIASLYKMSWLILPVILLLTGWGLVEAIERKWEGR